MNILRNIFGFCLIYGSSILQITITLIYFINSLPSYYMLFRGIVNLISSIIYIQYIIYNLIMKSRSYTDNQITIIKKYLYMAYMILSIFCLYILFNYKNSMSNSCYSLVLIDSVSAWITLGYSFFLGIYKLIKICTSSSLNTLSFPLAQNQYLRSDDEDNTEWRNYNY